MYCKVYWYISYQLLYVYQFSYHLSICLWATKGLFYISYQKKKICQWLHCWYTPYQLIGNISTQIYFLSANRISTMTRVWENIISHQKVKLNKNFSTFSRICFRESRREFKKILENSRVENSRESTLLRLKLHKRKARLLDN